MIRRFRPPGSVAMLVLGIVLLVALASADPHRLPWNSVNSGGQPGVCGCRRLSSSVAQGVVGSGVARKQHGSWGFWYGIPVMLQPDLGVQRIVAPCGLIDSSASIVPQVWIRNYGRAPALSFVVSFVITDSSGKRCYCQNVTVHRLSGADSTVVTFMEWPQPHPTGDYPVRCSTNVACDANPANDVVDGAFAIVAPPQPYAWVRKADVPTGHRLKYVKDGGCLAAVNSTDAGTSDLYALKGNKTCEFYCYNAATDSWTTCDSIPAVGRSGKKKGVRKGGCLAQAEGSIYAAKGGNTLDFWRFEPPAPSFTQRTGESGNVSGGANLDGSAYPWTEVAPVPAGGKSVKEGSGLTTLKLGDTTFVYLLKGSGTQEFYRYNTLTNAWTRRADAPAGISGRAYKDGSCVASGGTSTIFALKGTYDEFFSYDALQDTWGSLAVLPMPGKSGRKTKVKSGAGLAYRGGALYALKGGNTIEFWTYRQDSGKWTQCEDMPMSGGRRVKGGGALVSLDHPDALYALKGNNTYEFWQYNFPTTGGLPATGDGVQGWSSGARPAYALRVAPNPFSRATLVTYSLPADGLASLRLYDVEGRLVLTLAGGRHSAGSYTVSLTRPAGLARGVYWLRFEAGADAVHRSQKIVVE